MMSKIFTHYMRFVACFLLLLPALLGWSQQPCIRHLGVPEGLSDLLINTIHRDTAGLVWLGTNSSVELFDGIRLTHFPLPADDASSQRVTAIVGSSDSYLFAGNATGLYCLSTTPNQPIARAQWKRIGEDKIVGAISDLYCHQQTLYIATDHGLYTLAITPQLSTITHYPLHPNDLNSANQLRHLCRDDNGTLWMTSPVGLHALLPNQQVSHYLYTDLPEDGFGSICYVNDTLLLGTFHSGVYYFAIPSVSYGIYRHSVQPVSAIQAVGNDTLFVATDGGGVQWINRHTAQLLPNRIPLNFNNVYSMLYDSQGLLWVGYYQQGLDYTVFQDHIVRVYDTPMWSSYGKAVRAFATYGQYKAIGTRDGLFLIDEHSQRVWTYTEAQLNAQMIFAICYHDNRFYIGTFGGGLYTLTPSTAQLTPVCASVGSQIFCLTPDSTDLLWVGSEKGVFALRDNRIVQHFDATTSQLPEGKVYAIFFDRMSRGWFCTQSGMAIYDPEQRTIRTDVFPGNFPAKQAVRSVFQDTEGWLYFLPDKGHVFICNERLRPVSVDMPPVDGLFLTQDPQQHIWLGTTNGLYRLTRQQPATNQYYDFSSGLPDNIFTLCQPVWDANGRLWMGHSRGLVYLHPDSLNTVSTSQPRVIDVQQQNGNVTFLFSDLRYTLPQYTHYTYRLKGYETSAQTLNGYNHCTYSNLPMGRYTLLLSNGNGQGKEYAFSLRVPMSRQDWLMAIVLLLLAVVILLLVLYLTHRHRYHPKTESYRSFHMTEPQLKSLHARFCRAVEDERLYLNPSLRIADVAARISSSSYSISYMLSQYKHVNFNDYINRLRIETFCQRVKKGDAKRFSIETLAQECGFVSRAGFFRNFKKQMGKTPNEYIQTYSSSKS